MQTKHWLLGLGAVTLGYVVWKSTSSAPSSGTVSGSASDAKRSTGKCAGNLPAPTTSTDFDGMPPEFRTVYEEPMHLSAADVTHLTQEAAALGAESLASQAACAGYSVAASKLNEKAKEIRSWTPAAGFYS